MAEREQIKKQAPARSDEETIEEVVRQLVRATDDEGRSVPFRRVCE